MPAEIHIGNCTTFEATIRDQDEAVVDVSGASSKVLRFRDPGGNIAEQAASFVTDGTNGKIKYKTGTSELDEEGEWRVQGKAVVAGDTFYSEWHHFWVHDNE